MMMVQWICNVTLKDRRSSDELNTVVGKHMKLGRIKLGWTC